MRHWFDSQLPRHCQTFLDLMDIAWSPKAAHCRSNGQMVLHVTKLVDIMIEEPDKTFTDREEEEPEFDDTDKYFVD